VVAWCWKSDNIARLLSYDSTLVIAGLIVMGVFLEQMIRYRVEGAAPRLAGTLLAVTYLGVGGALILAIRMRYGVPVLVMFLGAVKFTDIGAYFTGSLVGKHKMIPWLSPGKTWEGLAGGLAAAALVSLLAVWAMDIRAFGAPFASAAVIGKAIAFGVIVGAAGQFGDLCESLLKRSAGVKDSGALVPEFGGILDMIDSPLLAAPVAMILLAIGQ
jgi:phosphatidate cytidylyltransferase